MNVPKPNNKPLFLIVAGITLLAIPLTIFTLQNQTIFKQNASSDQQTATASCDSTTGTAVINITFNNTKSDKDVNVVAKDLQSGKTLELGTVAKLQSKTVKIDSGLKSLLANGVTFTMTNADNTPGTDTATANYKSVSTCPAPASAANAFCPAGVSSNQGTCAWDPLAGAEGYQLTVKESLTGKIVQQVSLGKNASQSAFPMTPGTSYTCKIAGTNSSGVGTWSESPAKVCAGTPTPTPNACPSSGPPLGFCRWDALEGASGYQVSIKNMTSGKVEQTGTVNAPETSYGFPDSPDQTYQCIVVATKGYANTPPAYSPPSSCTAPTPTVAPTATPAPTLEPTPTPAPTITPLPTPTPAVVVRTVTSPPNVQVVQQPPQQTVVQQPGQTTVVQQPGAPRTVVQPVYTTPKPQPTLAPTGSSTGTVVMVGASALLLLVGGLVFFIL